MIDLTTNYPSILALSIMWLIVFSASVVQATLGMGYGLAAAPLLALVHRVFIPVPTIIIGMISSSMSAVGEWNQIMWKDVLLAATGRIAGVIAAVFVIAIVIDKR